MNGLKSFLFFNELSQQEVAQYLGISKGQMSKLVSGTSQLKDSQKAKLIANNHGWNTEFLTDNLWIKLEQPIMKEESGQLPRTGLPLIPTDAVAGYGTPAYDDMNVLDYYDVREFSNCDFLLRVKGDSMSPKYNGGDLIACKRVNETLFFQWGRVYAICTGSQGVMIKRVRPSENEGCIKCVSDNDNYAPFDVPKSDIVALALVNGSISLD